MKINISLYTTIIKKTAKYLVLFLQLTYITISYAQVSTTKKLTLFFTDQPIGSIEYKTSSKKMPCLILIEYDKSNSIIKKLNSLSVNEPCISLDTIREQLGYNVVLLEEYDSLFLIKQQRIEYKDSPLDFGQAGMFLNYDLNLESRKEYDFFDQQESVHNDSLLDITTGLNYQEYAIRSDIKKDQNDEWQMATLSLTRILPQYKTRLVLGDDFDLGRVFEANNRQGLTIQSDDRLRPENEQLTLPIVQGVAKGEADVTIMQGQNQLLRRRVPAGVFRFTDIPLPNGNTPIFLLIQESDGTVTSSLITPTVLPTVINKGNLWYDLFAGQLKSDPYLSFLDLPNTSYAQLNGIYGVSNWLSAFSGTQQAELYHAYRAGIGLNLYQWGLLSSGITSSDYRFTPYGQSYLGQRFDISYAHSLLDNKLSVILNANRYQGTNYMMLSEYHGYLSPSNIIFYQQMPPDTNRKYDARINFQYQIPNGSLSLSLNQTYHLDSSTSENYSVFANYFGQSSINQSISLSYFKTPFFNNYSISYGISFPLYSGEQNYVSASTRSSFNGERLNQNIDIYGSMLENSPLNYTVSTETQNQSYAGSLNYQHHYGNSQVNYAKERNSSISRLSTNGSIVLHQKGVSFGEKVMDQYGIVCLDSKKSGVIITQNSSQQTDSNGCMVIPSLDAYQDNTILLQPSFMATSDDMNITTRPSERAFIFKVIEQNPNSQLSTDVSVTP